MRSGVCVELQLIELLIEHGANLNAANNQMQYTPLIEVKNPLTLVLVHRYTLPPPLILSLPPVQAVNAGNVDAVYTLLVNGFGKEECCNIRLDLAISGGEMIAADLAANEEGPCNLLFTKKPVKVLAKNEHTGRYERYGWGGAPCLSVLW